MPATYVTAATLKASLGVGTLYDSYTWIEDTCQAAQDLINGFLWFDNAPVVGTALVSNVATVMVANPGIFTTGQSVTLAQAQLISCQRLICSLTIGNSHRAIVLFNMQKLQQIKTLGAYCLMALCQVMIQKLLPTPTRQLLTLQL